MEYRTSRQIDGDGDVINPRALSRDQRLDRWAKALEKRGGERLRTLEGTEFKPPAERLSMRAPNSPLTVAYEDPVLRSAGLEDDSYGEAMRFFGLSHWHMHRIVCECHYGKTLSAQDAASEVRSLSSHPSIAAQLALAGGVAGAALGGSLVVLAAML